MRDMLKLVLGITLIMILLLQITTACLAIWPGAPRTSAYKRIVITGTIIGNKVINLGGRNAVVIIQATVKKGQLTITNGNNVMIRGIITLVNSNLNINDINELTIIMNPIIKYDSSISITDITDATLYMRMYCYESRATNALYLDNIGKLHVERMIVLGRGLTSSKHYINIGSYIDSTHIKRLYMYIAIIASPTKGTVNISPLKISSYTTINDAEFTLNVNGNDQYLNIVPLTIYGSSTSRVNVNLNKLIIHAIGVHNSKETMVNIVNSNYGILHISDIYIQRISLQSLDKNGLYVVKAINSTATVSSIQLNSITLKLSKTTNYYSYASILCVGNSTINLGKVKIGKIISESPYLFMLGLMNYAGSSGKSYAKITNTFNRNMLLNTNATNGQVVLNGEITFTIQCPTEILFDGLPNVIEDLAKNTRIEVIFNNVAIWNSCIGYRLLLNGKFADIFLQSQGTITLIINGKVYHGSILIIQSAITNLNGYITVKETWNGHTYTIIPYNDQLVGFYNGTYVPSII